MKKKIIPIQMKEAINEMVKELQTAYVNLYNKKLSVSKALEMIKEKDFDILDEEYCSMMRQVIALRTKNISQNKMTYTEVNDMDKDQMYYYYNTNYFFDVKSGDFVAKKRVCKKCKKEFKINSLYEQICPSDGCGFKNDYLE